MKNNSYKEQVCIKYKEILEIIMIISKGYILQRQLIQYMILLDIASSEYNSKQIISELEDAELVKKIRFADTNNKIILLRKYAIRFLQDKQGSGSVGAISTCTTNKRYYKSISINEYCLTLISSNKNFCNNAKKYGLIKTMQLLNINLALDNVKVYNNLKNLPTVNKLTVESHIAQIEEYRTLRKKIMQDAKRGIKQDSKSVENLTAMEYRDNLMFSCTLETLLRKDCYIHFKYVKESNFYIISVNYFDYCNKQNSLKIVENIAVAIAICRDLFYKENYRINFNVWLTNDLAVTNIQKKLTYDYTMPILKMYGHNTSKQELSKILNLKYYNLDIDKKYFSNVKKIID